MPIYPHTTKLTKAFAYAFGRTWQEDRVALNHIGRCGSTVLATCFSSSPIFWDGEILEDLLCGETCHWPPNAHQGGTVDSSELSAYASLRARYSPNKTYLCEFKPFQCARLRSDIKTVLQHYQPTQSITLYRRNLFHVLLSAYRAGLTGVWHSNKKEAAVSIELPIKAPFVLDRRRATLIEHLDCLARDTDTLLNLPADLTLTYEDDIKVNPSQAADKLSALLHIPISGSPALQKPTTQGHLGLLNCDAIDKALSGTPYQKMLSV
jgi:hypothetical protein